MADTIMVQFTKGELSALIHAAGNIMSHPDMVNQEFKGGARHAAERGWDKLLTAYHEIKGPSHD